MLRHASSNTLDPNTHQRRSSSSSTSSRSSHQGNSLVDNNVTSASTSRFLASSPAIVARSNMGPSTVPTNSRSRASNASMPSTTLQQSSAALGGHEGSALLGALPSSAQLNAHAAAAAMGSSSAFGGNGISNLPTQSSSISSPATSTTQQQQHAQGHATAPQPPSPYLFHQSFAHQAHQAQQQPARITMERFTADLTNYIIAFLSPILPTEEEYRIKEATRRQLERLAGKVSPGAKLLAFGSMANGFALKNSDMDLCCLIAGDDVDKSSPPKNLNASELVEVLGRVIREETDFNVMPLPKARIPIIKITRPPTSELPYDISCDIGFENRLALENTRLLLSYAMVDAPRLRTLVLFLKVWTKRRKLNSPYTGTLSSYGYTLMMLFFLIHIKRPAVLPNLQKIPPSVGSTSKAQDASLNGHDIYFYDDVATLRREWSSMNTENVGELLLDFFRYFSKDFSYSRDVISIRTETGLQSRDGATWLSELCIEDPFQHGYNVARTVTKDGLYTIRGEFMRASRILTTKVDRVSAALAELCEEREDGLTRAPSPSYYGRTRTPYNSGYQGQHMYLPGGGFDPRYLRDVTRRFDANPILHGFGGSFAFEEMARGLGQVQRGPTMAFPPTAAMLAPLSQNPGLGPRQSLMRAGLRYDATTRGAPSNTPNSSPSPQALSSARSEDGGGATYEKRRAKRAGTNPTSGSSLLAGPSQGGHAARINRGHASTRTSPTLANATPEGLLHPNSALHGAYGIGEAFAYGSEISFGSQRFQLHPPSAVYSNHDDIAGDEQSSQRGSRSFSDGVNRSKSLPRSVLDSIGDGVRRSSTPMLSEPPSPTREAVRSGVSLPSRGGIVAALDPSMASLSLRSYGRASSNSQRSASSRSSVSGADSGQGPVAASDNARGAPSAVFATSNATSMRRSTSAQTAPVQTSLLHQEPEAAIVTTNASDISHPAVNGSPYLTTSPWEFLSAREGRGSKGRTGDDSSSGRAVDEKSFESFTPDDGEDAFAIDDEVGTSLSDGTLDELARVSAMESGESDGEAASGIDRSAPSVSSANPHGSKHSVDGGPLSESHQTSAPTGNKEHDVRSWAAAQQVQVAANGQHRHGTS